jgi:hypothetical protein
LVGRNVALVAGTDRVLRIGFTPVEGAAQMRVDVRPPTLQVALCPLERLDDAIRIAACKDVVSGVFEDVASPRMRGIAVVLHGASATADFTLEYDEDSREVSLRLPSIPRPAGASVCKDNACNPFFELLPTRTGSFRASASWTGGRATLVLLQGRVLGRSLTATGIPYLEAARDDGSSPLRISTQLTAPGEYALALRTEAGSRALDSIAIDARWP